MKITSSIAFFLVSAFCYISFAQTVSPDLGQCVLAKKDGAQKLYKCKMNNSTKELSVLDLYGTVAETAYYHGYFLRKEIENGILKGIHAEMGRALESMDKDERSQFLSLSKCVISNFRGSVSSDFHVMVYNQYRGMKAAGSSITKKEMLEANLMVDLSIYFETIQRKLEQNPSKAKKEVIAACGAHIAFQKLGSMLGKAARSMRKLKMGCTGVASSAAHSRNGDMIWGRNFDTGLLGFFERYPLVLIQNNPNGIRSVGMATAGLHFAGGISGFNNYGLVGSLHQLQTEDAKIRQEPYSSETTPYLLHKILNETTNLDQAIAVVKAKKGFGAWTIFIGDSKTDEIASIEIAGSKVAVARRNKNSFMGQSNHYLAPLTQQGGFEYSLNKSLESRARLSLVTERLGEAQGQVETQWVINMLSGHTDYLVGQRAFGRTTTKVYTAATHVMVPARQEWWMTLGETYPTNQGQFIGFRMDALTGGKFTLIGRTYAEKEYVQENWYKSQGEYVKAYMAHEDNFRSLPQTEKVLAHLTEAIRLAESDGILEFPYYYVRGRIYLYQAALENRKKQTEAAEQSLSLAWADFQKLEQLTQQGLIQSHPYERGLIALWSSRVSALSGRKDLKQNALVLRSESSQRLGALSETYKKHYDFQKLLKEVNKDFTVSQVLDSEVKFGTVE
ncbi:Acyl-coenzyme A:6-aminopenicillanic acid acyl-transferase [compost metagenome]